VPARGISNRIGTTAPSRRWIRSIRLTRCHIPLALRRAAHADRLVGDHPKGLPCRVLRRATTGGRAFRYLPGAADRTPARDRSRHFASAPRPRRTRDIAGWGEAKCGRPPETRCSCSSCLGCSCCGRTGGRCLDYCSTTPHATHGLLLTCPRVQGFAPVTPK
jgi:hypothetical protein